MATRGKGLSFDLDVFECSNFNMALFSKLSLFIRDSMSAPIVSFKKLNENFYLFFFDNRIFKNTVAKIKKIWTMKNPLVTSFSVCYCGSLVNSSAKVFLKFFQNLFVGINNARSGDMKIKVSSIVRGWMKFKDIKRSFSINKSSKVSKIFFLSHKVSSLSNNVKRIIPDLKCLAATKQAKGRSRNRVMRCSELMGNHERTAEKIVPLRFVINVNINNETKSNKSNRLTYVIITKQVTLINEDPVLNAAAARLGQSMRETEDQLVRDMLLAGASPINCTGGANGDNPTEVSRSDVDGVVATLQGNNGEFISEMIGGEDKFGTSPIRDAYFAMGSTSLIGQLENVQGFIAKAQYPEQKNTLPSEWGTIGNTRWFLSSRASVTPTSSLLGADIYNSFIAAQEAYTTVELNGATASFIYHPPGWGDDPSELRQTCAYRFVYASCITQNSWLVNLRSTLA